MQITGTVVDQATGKPLPAVTIWEVSADGRSAEVIGYSDSQGKYSVNLMNENSGVNFVVDGYTGTNIPAVQAAGSDQVLLARDGSFSARLTFQNVPAWLWLLAGMSFIFLIGDSKKQK